MNIQRTSTSQTQDIASTSRQPSQPSFTKTVARLGHQCLQALSSSAGTALAWCCNPTHEPALEPIPEPSTPSLENLLQTWVSKLHPYEQSMGAYLARGIQAIPRNSEVLHLAVKTSIDPPNISKFFPNVKELIYLTHNSKITDWIGDFLTLKDLRIEANHAEHLPDLSKLRALKKLKLKECRMLQALPADITTLGLTTLSLDRCLNLVSLPENLGDMSYLQTLNLSRCFNLQRIPDSVITLSHLLKLSVSDCRRLSSLPLNILDLPNYCEINVEGSGLSANIIEALRLESVRREEQGLSAPRVTHSLLDNDANVEEETKPLAEEIADWFTENKAEKTKLHANELELIAQKPSHDTQALAILLKRLRKTAMYGHQPEATAQRISTLLRQALATPTLFDAQCAQALECIASCDDRTALGLVIMEQINAEFHILQHAKQCPSPQTAYQYLKTEGEGLFYQRKLLDIAHEHAKEARGAVDETEIILKYLTVLGNEFNLPFNIEHMLFAEHGWQVNQTALDLARTQLHALNATQKKTMMASWAIYKDSVKHHEPDMVRDLEKHLATQSTAFNQQLEPLTAAFKSSKEQWGPLDAKTLNINIQINQLKADKEKAMLQPWYEHVEKSISFE